MGGRLFSMIYTKHSHVLMGWGPLDHFVIHLLVVVLALVYTTRTNSRRSAANAASNGRPAFMSLVRLCQEREEMIPTSHHRMGSGVACAAHFAGTILTAQSMCRHQLSQSKK